MAAKISAVSRDTTLHGIKQFFAKHFARFRHFSAQDNNSVEINKLVFLKASTPNLIKISKLNYKF